MVGFVDLCQLCQSIYPNRIRKATDINVLDGPPECGPPFQSAGKRSVDNRDGEDRVIGRKQEVRRSRFLVCLLPVGAGTYIRHQWDVQLRNA